MSSIKTTSFLSEHLELTGTLRLEGGIRIDGQVNGDIESKSTIYAGESAQIKGNIITENLVSAGNIQGEVTAYESVRIKSPGSLKGRVSTAAMMIDKEVFFDGSCRLTAPKEIEVPATETPKVPRRAILGRK